MGQYTSLAEMPDGMKGIPKSAFKLADCSAQTYYDQYQQIDVAQAACDYYLLEAILTGQLGKVTIDMKRIKSWLEDNNYGLPVEDEFDDSNVDEFAHLLEWTCDEDCIDCDEHDNCAIRGMYLYAEKTAEAAALAVMPDAVDDEQDVRITTMIENVRLAKSMKDDLVAKLTPVFENYGKVAIPGELGYDVGWKEFAGSNNKKAFQAIIDTVGIERAYEYASMYFGTTWSGAYGGQAWKNCSDVYFHFYKGWYSAEQFVDRVFALEHNGGTFLSKVGWGQGNPMYWNISHLKFEVLPAHGASDWEKLLMGASDDVKWLFNKAWFDSYGVTICGQVIDAYTNRWEFDGETAEFTVAQWSEEARITHVANPSETCFNGGCPICYICKAAFEKKEYEVKQAAKAAKPQAASTSGSGAYSNEYQSGCSCYTCTEHEKWLQANKIKPVKAGQTDAQKLEAIFGIKFTK